VKTSIYLFIFSSFKMGLIVFFFLNFVSFHYLVF